MEKVKKVSVGYVGSDGLFDSATVNAYTASLRGLSATQAEVVLSSSGLDSAQRKQIISALEATAATKTLTTEEALSAMTRKSGNAEAAKELLIKSRLVTKDQLEAGAEIQVSTAKLKSAVASGALTQSEADNIAVALGLTGTNIGLGTSFKLLATSIWASVKAMAAWLFTTPAGWTTLAIGGIVGATIAINKYNEKLEESRRELVQVGKEAADTNKSLAGLVDQYEKLGEDGKIDTSELDTAKNIQEQIVDLIGGQAKDVDLVNGKYDEQIKKLQEIKLLGADGTYSNMSRAAEAAEENMRSGIERNDGSKPQIMGGAIQTADESKAIKSAMSKAGVTQFGTEYYDGTYKFTIDTSTSEKIAESYYAAVELANTIAHDYKDDIKDGNGDLFDFYNQLNDFIDKNREDVEAYSTAMKNLHEADAKLELAEYLKTNSINSQDSFDAYIEGINNSTEYSEEYKKVLINVANDTFPKFANATQTAGENLDQMTVSLSEMKAASDSISALSSAFKQLSDDGYLTTESISKIQEATKLSGDEWAEYETKLLNAKAGSAEFNQVMSELTYKILENKFGTIDLTNATEEEISAIEDKIEATLRENNVANASAIAQEFVAKKKAQVQIQNKIAKDGIDSVIDGLKDETNWCGLTANAYAQLVAKEIIFNNNDLDVSGKLTKLQSLYGMLGLVGDKWERLNNAISGTPQQNSFGNINAGIYKREGENRQYEWVYNGVSYSTEEEAQQAYMIDQINKDIVVKNTNPIFTNPGKSGSDNTPDYEDPTDAIINRINLRAKELEQQEEQIENAIEIAELEKDYEKQISLTNDKLAIQKQRVDALKTSNSELHQMAEDLRNSTPQWNEEEWFDSQGNATEAYIELYNSRSKEEQEAIKDQFEKINKIKEAWVDNDEEIVELNKEILQDAEDLNEIYDDLANSKIDDIEHQIELNINNNGEDFDNRTYYKQIQDIAHAEAERLRALDPEKYKDQIHEWQNVWWDAQHNIEDWLDDIFSKATDFASSYYDSQKTLLQSYYDTTNSIAEAQHEITKELEASKTMYEYLNEETRKLLFNQEAYNVLSEELYDIQYQADKLQRQYQRDLENSTLSTIEEITSNYEMQYETLMKSYEIAKAELEVAKKRQKLDNVLNERNVRMFINGQWQWVAKTQDVIDAQNELADAQYEAEKAKLQKEQTDSVNNLTAQQDKLATTINEFEEGIIDLDTAVSKVKDMFEDLPDAMREAFSKMQSASSSGSSSGGSSYGKGSTIISSSDGGAYVSATLPGGMGSTYVHVNSDGKTTTSVPEGTIIHTAGGDYKVTGGSAGNYTSERIDHEYATGTGSALPGSALLGEIEPEMLIKNGGHLIPINQPTLANLQGGEMVLNQSQMKDLRDFWSIGNVWNPNSANLINKTAPSTVGDTNCNNIYINGLKIDSDSDIINIEALKRYAANH